MFERAEKRSSRRKMKRREEVGGRRAETKVERCARRREGFWWNEAKREHWKQRGASEGRDGEGGREGGQIVTCLDEAPPQLAHLGGAGGEMLPDGCQIEHGEGWRLVAVRARQADRVEGEPVASSQPEGSG